MRSNIHEQGIMGGKMKVTRKTIIADAVNSHPKVAEIMFDYGLHCIGCAVSADENIEDGCAVHGMPDEKIDEMISKINAALEKEEKK